MLNPLYPHAKPHALPGVWQGDAWACGSEPVVPSGHTALDAELPGGGWPTGELIELLQAPSTRHEWRLLSPALRLAQQRGPLVLVGAPHLPHLTALAAQGLDSGQLLWIDVLGHGDRLWAAEQVLRSGTAGAVLVWLPEARPEQLRRLHLAARAMTHHAASSPATHQATQAGPLLLTLRPEALRHQASPAPLRLMLSGAQGRLKVQIFKRRGPPMEQPLTLKADLPVMACLRHWPPHNDRDTPVSAIPSVPAHVVDRPAAQPRHAFA